MIYVILGMHKSGTTLISQILHHSGIDMGEEIDPQTSYDQGNKYERLSTRNLNLEILGLKNVFVPSIDLDGSYQLRMTADQRARMREIIRQCTQAHMNWGFKDPRTCLVYPLWAEELPEHKLIATYRLPEEVWPRYRHKSPYRSYQNLRAALCFVRGWCSHNSNIIKYLSSTEMDFLVLNYCDLVKTDSEFGRLQRFVGFPLNDQRNPNLYRGRPRPDLPLRVATWWVGRQKGRSPAQIVQQLEALRYR